MTGRCSGVSSVAARVECDRPDAARSGEVAVRSGQSAHGTRHRESHVAAVLRHRPGRHRKRLRHAGLAADASRVARLAGQRTGPPRLEHEEPAPADRHVGDLSAKLGVARRSSRARSEQPIAWPVSRGSGSKPRRSATRRWRPAACCARRSAAPAFIPRSPRGYM